MTGNQRARIRMSPAEVDQFLGGRHSMSMASFAPDGTIHLVAMWYGFVDGLVAVETKTASQKVHNLRRDPRVTVLVETGESYETLRGVEIVGRAEIVEGGTRLRAIAASVLSRYVLDDDTHLEAAVDAALHKRVGVVVHPTRIVSWDHAKLS
jgi:PPOX class probable F420-dependent enzyme